MTHTAVFHNPLSRVPIIFLGMIWLLVCSDLPLAAAAPPPLPDPDHIRYQPLSFELPRVERVVLDNGVRLYILPDSELPLVQIKVVVGTGNMYDPPGQEGLAELTAATMRTGGKAGMSGDEVDEALESMAANFQISSNRDSTTFSFSVLKNNLDRGLDLFFGTLMQPSFEESKLILVKDLKIEELRRIADDPQKLAFREFGRLMHEGSPRGRLSTSKSIQTIGREDVLRCYRRFFYPKNIMISITGDIENKEAIIVVNRYLGAWRSQGDKPEAPPVPQPQGGNIFFLAKDVPQSVLIFGCLAPAKRDIRFYPFEVLDFIVGSGGFRSRIFQEIRTNMGLAYSTGSFYKANSEYGLFGAYAFTKSESVVKVSTRMREILREMGELSVSRAELEGAKKSILNSFIFSFTSAEQICLQRLMIEYDGMSDDFLTTYRSRIGNVKAEDIRDRAAQYLSPAKTIFLVIGSEQIYQDISANFGKVTRIDATF
jgi:zinc protease